MSLEQSITEPERRQAPPIYVLSGGTGATGELLARTVLAQYRDVQAEIIIAPNIHTVAEVEDIVLKAAADGGSIIHTMVNPDLHSVTTELTRAHNVFAVDLAGPIMDYLTERLGQKPIGAPGLYRESNIAYFRRVEAIEFTVAHDDGKRSDNLCAADIVIIGVSRCGKTPLSMYLSMLGWKVANVPIVPGVEPPASLAHCDKRRVVALDIDPQKLMAHRRWRQQHLGVSEGYYTDRANIVEELREYHHFVYRHGFTMFDVTDKPIETSGEELILLVSKNMSKPAAPAGA
jgi:hypothetical protein